MLEDLGNVGDFLGGIGVVATLVYLALQIRQNSSQLAQNTKAVQSNAYQAITQNHNSYNEWFVPNRELAELLTKANTDADSVDDVDQLRLNGMSSSMLRNFENVHEQFRAGLVTEAQWLGWSRLLTGMLTTNSIHRVFWSRGGNVLYTPDFQHFINGVISSIEETRKVDS